jgi:fatty acid CoA ligase FadD9
MGCWIEPRPGRPRVVGDDRINALITATLETLQGIANYIETQRRPGLKRPTFASVHGHPEDGQLAELDAGDLKLDKFIDEKTIGIRG